MTLGHHGAMPRLDLMDDTWIAATSTDVADVVAQPGRWAGWWPDLKLEVQERRGPEGVRWRVRHRSGLAGTMEIWLEPSCDGVLLHYFLRLDPPSAPAWSARRVDRARNRFALRAKQNFWALKDELEADASVETLPADHPGH